VAQNRRADREHHPSWVITQRGEHVVDQPTVDTTVAIDEGVHIDEAERDCGSGGYRITSSSENASVVQSDAGE
jgi:hypothetical protein